jgi:hypothetical protein
MKSPRFRPEHPEEELTELQISSPMLYMYVLSYFSVDIGFSASSIAAVWSAQKSGMRPVMTRGGVI